MVQTIYFADAFLFPHSTILYVPANINMNNHYRLFHINKYKESKRFRQIKLFKFNIDLMTYLFQIGLILTVLLNNKNNSTYSCFVNKNVFALFNLFF